MQSHNKIITIDLKIRFLSRSIALVLLLTSGVIFYGQDRKEFIEQVYENKDNPNLIPFFDFYMLYDQSDIADAVAVEISDEFLSKGENELYILNEISRTRHLNISGNSLKAFEVLDAILEDVQNSSSAYIKSQYHTSRGHIYYNAQMPEESKREFKKSSEFLNMSLNPLEIKINFINLGNLFNNEAQYDSALYYYDAALDTEKSGLTKQSVNLRSNIAVAYLNLQKNDSALVLFKWVYQHLDSSDHYSKVMVLRNLGECYHAIDQIDSAIYFYKSALTKASSYQINNIVGNIYSGLAKAYKRIGEVDLAYSYLDSSAQFQSEQEQQHLQREISEIEMKQLESSLNEKQEETEKELASEKSAKTYYLNLALLCLLALIILSVLYFLHHKKTKKLIQEQLELTKKENKEEPIPQKQEKEKDIELLGQIQHALDVDKKYMDPELNLEQLSKHLNTNRTYLSETINACFGINFNTLINNYRIREARELFTNSNFDHFSIEGVARHVGYNSLSSFNTAFKKITGITPSTFRKAALKSRS